VYFLYRVCLNLPKNIKSSKNNNWKKNLFDKNVIVYFCNIRHVIFTNFFLGFKLNSILTSRWFFKLKENIKRPTTKLNIDKFSNNLRKKTYQIKISLYMNRIIHPLTRPQGETNCKIASLERPRMKFLLSLWALFLFQHSVTNSICTSFLRVY